MLNKNNLVIFIILFAILAYLIDSQVPVLTFKMPISERVSIKVSVYDNSTGFTKTVVTNIKAMVDCWKGF